MEPGCYLEDQAEDLPHLTCNSITLDSYFILLILGPSFFFFFIRNKHPMLHFLVRFTNDKQCEMLWKL